MANRPRTKTTTKTKAAPKKKATKPAKQSSPKPPKTKRKAANIYLSTDLRLSGEDTAANMELFTAQGGVDRPAISMIVNGLLYMLKGGKIPMLSLYEASCEVAGRKPDERVIARIKAMS